MQDNNNRPVPKFQLWETVVMRYLDGVTDDIYEDFGVITGLAFAASYLTGLPGEPRWTYQVLCTGKSLKHQVTVGEDEIQKFPTFQDFTQ
ncbi:MULTISPECIES: hypothetical protein [Cyanophyceae]|uniref:hypothetical protein n=1 Tax=Cyanophyceae TaxID=3028117 RepID=UPI0016821436|nr:hypothetical protein [Trichocoleus sp. FACHB-40]MBD2006984.1 hypothetical protein [Trichocoleus sp. FACHB-40]